MTNPFQFHFTTAGADVSRNNFADRIKAHEDAGTTHEQLVALLDIELAVASVFDSGHQMMGIDEYVQWMQALGIEPRTHLQNLADGLLDFHDAAEPS